MADEPLIQTLQQFIEGRVALEDLLDAVRAAESRAPEQLMPFAGELDVLYARGALEFEIYTALKGRMDPATRARTPASQGGNATDVRPVGNARRESGLVTSGRKTRLEPGSVIIDRFVLEERIGAGGMGIVFKARDRYREAADDRDPYVAIKFLNVEFAKHPASLIALEREARKHMRLAHPNILTVHEFLRSPGSELVFLYMELLQGEPLDQFILRHPQGLPLDDAMPFVKGIGEALQYAHKKGVIHSDLKPGNVFALESGEVKVLDFGIAREVSTGALGDRGGTVFDAGTLNALTPEYASPEMLIGGYDPSESDDVYALACIAYELMAGRHPYGGTDAVRAAHDGLKVKRTRGMRGYHFKALLHGLAFKKADRTPSVRAFLDEFNRPESDAGKTTGITLRAVLATAAVVIPLLMVIFWYLQPNSDEVLVGRLEERGCAGSTAVARGSTQIERADPEVVANLLGLGNLMLAQASEGFDAAYLSASGDSDAYHAFCNALELDPGNRDAIRGIVGVVGLYEAEATRLLDKGRYVEASTLATLAREIDPDRESLADIEREAAEMLRAASQ